MTPRMFVFLSMPLKCSGEAGLDLRASVSFSTKEAYVCCRLQECGGVTALTGALVLCQSTLKS